MPLFEATLVVVKLNQHGIEATFEEAFNIVGKGLSHARIMVRVADFPAAQAVLSENR